MKGGGVYISREKQLGAQTLTGLGTHSSRTLLLCSPALCFPCVLRPPPPPLPAPSKPGARIWWPIFRLTGRLGTHRTPAEWGEGVRPATRPAQAPSLEVPPSPYIAPAQTRCSAALPQITIRNENIFLDCSHLDFCLRLVDAAQGCTLWAAELGTVVVPPHAVVDHNICLPDVPWTVDVCPSFKLCPSPVLSPAFNVIRSLLPQPPAAHPSPALRS